MASSSWQDHRRLPYHHPPPARGARDFSPYAPHPIRHLTEPNGDSRHAHYGPAACRPRQHPQPHPQAPHRERSKRWDRDDDEPPPRHDTTHPPPPPLQQQYQQYPTTTAPEDSGHHRSQFPQQHRQQQHRQRREPAFIRGSPAQQQAASIVASAVADSVKAAAADDDKLDDKLEVEGGATADAAMWMHRARVWEEMYERERKRCADLEGRAGACTCGGGGGFGGSADRQAQGGVGGNGGRERAARSVGSINGGEGASVSVRSLGGDVDFGAGVGGGGGRDEADATIDSSSALTASSSSSVAAAAETTPSSGPGSPPSSPSATPEVNMTREQIADVEEAVRLAAALPSPPASSPSPEDKDNAADDPEPANVATAAASSNLTASLVSSEGEEAQNVTPAAAAVSSNLPTSPVSSESEDEGEEAQHVTPEEQQRPDDDSIEREEEERLRRDVAATTASMPPSPSPTAVEQVRDHHHDSKQLPPLGGSDKDREDEPPPSPAPPEIVAAAAAAAVGGQEARPRISVKREPCNGDDRTAATTTPAAEAGANNGRQQVVPPLERKACAGCGKSKARPFFSPERWKEEERGSKEGTTGTERGAARPRRRRLCIACAAETTATWTCTACKQDKPNSCFSPSSEAGNDRLDTRRCRSCRSLHAANTNGDDDDDSASVQSDTPSVEVVLPCSSCGESKPREGFGKKQLQRIKKNRSQQRGGGGGGKLAAAAVNNLIITCKSCNLRSTKKRCAGECQQVKTQADFRLEDVARRGAACRACLKEEEAHPASTPEATRGKDDETMRRTGGERAKSLGAFRDVDEDLSVEEKSSARTTNYRNSAEVRVGESSPLNAAGSSEKKSSKNKTRPCVECGKKSRKNAENPADGGGVVLCASCSAKREEKTGRRTEAEPAGGRRGSSSLGATPPVPPASTAGTTSPRQTKDAKRCETCDWTRPLADCRREDVAKEKTACIDCRRSASKAGAEEKTSAEAIGDRCSETTTKTNSKAKKRKKRRIPRRCLECGARSSREKSRQLFVESRDGEVGWDLCIPCAAEQLGKQGQAGAGAEPAEGRAGAAKLGATTTPPIKQDEDAGSESTGHDGVFVGSSSSSTGGEVPLADPGHNGSGSAATSEGQYRKRRRADSSRSNNNSAQPASKKVRVESRKQCDACQEEKDEPEFSGEMWLRRGLGQPGGACAKGSFWKKKARCCKACVKRETIAEGAAENRSGSGLCPPSRSSSFEDSKSRSLHDSHPPLGSFSGHTSDRAMLDRTNAASPVHHLQVLGVLLECMHQAIDGSKKRAGWVRLTAVEPFLRDKNLDCTTCGYRRLLDLVKDHPESFVLKQQKGVEQWLVKNAK